MYIASIVYWAAPPIERHESCPWIAVYWISCICNLNLTHSFVSCFSLFAWKPLISIHLYTVNIIMICDTKACMASREPLLLSANGWVALLGTSMLNVAYMLQGKPLKRHTFTNCFYVWKVCGSSCDFSLHLLLLNWSFSIGNVHKIISPVPLMEVFSFTFSGIS